MDYSQYEIETIKNGYEMTNDLKYQCLTCGAIFETDEVFPINGRFYTAEKAVKHHVVTEHGNRLELLTNLDKKLTSLTDNQKDILLRMASGMSDKDIASELAISASTVRHMRFSMKEKAKQAKVFLALYELAFHHPEIPEQSTEHVPIHEHATMVDDRYLITAKEETQVLERFFISQSPLKLKTFSTKEKNKIVILKTIAAWLDPEKVYTEKALSDELRTVYEDFATLRRYLIEYGFMIRSKDGKTYKLQTER